MNAQHPRAAPKMPGVIALLTLSIGFIACPFADAATHYVSPSGAHVAPYASWATAATNIQDAISVTEVGDTVLVTNGVYDSGGVSMGNNTGRIAITNAVTVRSVNGPDSTFIVGSGALGDAAAVRCAYVGSGARLEGFTLTNGHSGPASVMEMGGGGAFCAPSAVVSNCTITGNRAGWGGGGAAGGTIQNCTITGNSAHMGGGTYWSTVQNCTITGNEGGGTFGRTVQNCTIAGNEGFGTSESTVQNCTITGNEGGGTYGGTVRNSIVYFNSARLPGRNCLDGTVEYTCTTPDPGGAGNITNAPGIAGLSNPHLVSNSPCIDAGTNQTWMIGAVDIDGEPRLGSGTVDMGCDEVYSGNLTGALAVALFANYSNVAVGFPIEFRADIQGRPAGYEVRWGDGGVPSNAPWECHAYDNPGDYEAVLQAWNLGGSIAATLTVHVVAGSTNYVSRSGSHTAPYGSWATAATNIQAAISAQTVAGGIVLVTNGAYNTGGVVIHGGMTNRIAITNAVTVRSVNGPDNTFIWGSGPLGDTAVRCAYVGDGARLEGFTLTNGHTRDSDDGEPYVEISGGGVFCRSTAAVSNCTISGNSARFGGGTYGGTVQNSHISGNFARYGGGTRGGTVQHCTITRNSADSGGGTSGGTVQNCTITGNSAEYGGGTYGGTVQHCTISGNSTEFGGGATYEGTVQNCTITGNSAGYGGGTYGGTVQHCTISGNSAESGGGGAASDYSGDRIEDCTISGNSAKEGGGVDWYGEGTIQNCTISGNTADNGGGVFIDAGTILNCTISRNTAGSRGGGLYFAVEAVIQNCTISGNTAGSRGGGYHGDRGVTVQNSIIHDNSAAGYPNYSHRTSAWSYTHCCTTPAVAGVGNIDVDPRLTPTLRLKADSPCIDAGSASNAPPTDMDGEARWDHPTHANIVSIVDMGADEFVDTDGDGMADHWETEHFGHLGNDAATDNDVDGGPDGLGALGEYELGTNPTAADTDEDLVPDGQEVVEGTDPLSEDTDTDGQWDGAEVIAGTDPLDTGDFFALRQVSRDPVNALPVISWQSVTGRLYTVSVSLDLGHEVWIPVLGQVDVPGTGSEMSYTNLNPDALGCFRIEVRLQLGQ